MELAKAERLALYYVSLLTDYCSKINVAGSIRREKAEVKDIEIVALPLKYSPVTDLFSTPSTDRLIIPAFQRTVDGFGKINKGKASGKYMQIALPSGINLDLFMPDEDDYFRQLAIRTGSADYAAKVIAAGWRRNGWCGSNEGLRKIVDCKQKGKVDGKPVWKCINPNAEKPPVWQSEQEFFDWLGIEWVEPRLRL